jgi:hypothetical protein
MEPAGPYGPASARGAGRRMGPRPGEQQLNPVLWQGSPDVVGPGHDDRRARVGPYSTAVVGNVLVRQDGRKGREDLRHEAETGASNLIYNRGPNAPGVEYGEGVEPNYRFDRALNRQVAGARTHELHRVRGGAHMRASTAVGASYSRQRATCALSVHTRGRISPPALRTHSSLLRAHPTAQSSHPNSSHRPS